MALVDYNPDWAQETKRMIDEEGGISHVIQADVTDEESCKNAVAKTVELYGAVHVLVNIGKSHSGHTLILFVNLSSRGKSGLVARWATSQRLTSKLGIGTFASM